MFELHSKIYPLLIVILGTFRVLDSIWLSRREATASNWRQGRAAGTNYPARQVFVGFAAASVYAAAILKLVDHHAIAYPLAILGFASFCFAIAPPRTAATRRKIR